MYSFKVVVCDIVIKLIDISVFKCLPAYFALNKSPSVPPQVLMNKVLNTPHDPYVTVDSTFWPPYVEMLLRYGIAVRHQESNFKIRLETFC